MTGGAIPQREAALGSGAATIAVIIAAFCFASISIATVLATRTGAPLLTLLVGRYVGATLSLLPITGLAWRHVPRRQAIRLLVLGGLGQAAVAYLTLSALDYIPAATLVFLFYSFPAWVAVLAAIRGTERIGPRRRLALALSLGGIVLMVGLPGSGMLPPLGVGLALAGAVVYALYIPFLENAQRGISSAVATLHVAIGVSIILGAAAAMRGELTTDLAPVAWGAILWLGVVCTTVAFICFLRGLAVLGPVRTSIASTAEPFFAAILAALLLDQPITVPALVGGACIAAAVILLQRTAGDQA